LVAVLRLLRVLRVLRSKRPSEGTTQNRLLESRSAEPRLGLDDRTVTQTDRSDHQGEAKPDRNRPFGFRAAYHAGATSDKKVCFGHHCGN
jgi:hypothetical protein